MKTRPLVGPVLFYDLMCSARRTRFIMLRVVYAGILFLVLIWVASTWSLKQQFNPTPGNPVEESARMAESYFSTFLTLQMLAVLFLTPAYVAGAISEEKERRTLEFMLATDLANREIVLSKLLSRLANLAFLLLAGLPILSLMQFLGGVDPLLLLVGFAVTAITMTSLASISMLLSVYARRSRDAAGLAYLGIVAYLSATFFGAIMLRYAIPAVGATGLSLGDHTLTLLDVVEFLGTGNIFLAYFHLALSMGGGARLADMLLHLLGEYTLFHFIVTAVCVAWAVTRLRAVALKQAATPATGKAVRQRLRHRPPVGRAPMIWKEVYAESGFRFGPLGRIILAVVVAGSFVPAVWIVIDYLQQPGRYFTGPFFPQNRLAEHINVWVRITTSALSCLLLLAVAVRASGSISGERDRQTMDSLLTTPLDSRTILWAKWLGSILSVRWGWLWLGLIWVVGIVCGGLHLPAVPWLVMYWLAFAALLAAIGLYYSMTCRTTLRATVATVLTSVFLGGGHWPVLGLCFYLPLSVSRILPPREVEYIASFEAFGLTPPLSIGWLAMREGEQESQRPTAQASKRFTRYAVAGILIWAVGAGVVFGRANRRFRIVTYRGPLRRPSGSPQRSAEHRVPSTEY
jgi:ABC-type transport system involved in multi-copper enzyme maturation permease subunit